MAKKTPKNKDQPTFESALAELEELIHTMENDQLPLETLVSSYEKGAELLKICEKVLNNARKRIEIVQLSGSDENELDSEGNQAEDVQDASNSKPDDADSDDIRLF